MQQVWSQAAVVSMLALCSAEDIKKKQIRLHPVLLFGIFGVFLHMLFRMQPVENMLLGMLVGVTLLILSILTGGRIGAGDAVLLIVTGIYLGFEQNMQLFFSGSLLCGIWALGVLILKKKGRKDSIPFIPFLLAAYMGMLVLAL